jgi:hypothetical protein
MTDPFVGDSTAKVTQPEAPPPAPGARAGGLRLVGALALSVAAALTAPAATPDESGAAPAPAVPAAPRFAPAVPAELEQAASEKLVDQPPSLPAESEPAQCLEAARGAVQALRPEDWEVGALAAALGKDPAAAFEFVRDAIGFDPYPGVLRGAAGTLAARAGNAWDRALLLRALLVGSRLRTRFAFATLDRDAAAALVLRAHQRPARRLPGTAPVGPVARVSTGVAARARRDAAALQLALGSRYQELGVDDAELIRQEVTRHVWVQVFKDNAWLDLDPTPADAQPGKALVPAASTADEIRQDQQDAVLVRVVAEMLTDGKLSETVSLERSLPAATAADQYLLLEFSPAANRGGGGLLFGGGSGGKSPPSFVPSLRVGDQKQAGRPIATSAGGGGGAGGLFGGALAGGGGPSELVGVYIDVETRVPGRKPIAARHVLLDRVRPEARSAPPIASEALKPVAQGGGVPGALAGFHHLMISTGGSNPLDMAKAQLSTVAAAAAPAAPAGDPASKSKPQPPPPPSPARLVWAIDRALVEGSERLVVRALDATEGGRAYVDQPRVFLASWIPDTTGTDEMSRETDLLLDSVRILPPDGAPVREIAARQLEYGVLQSALETETALQLAAIFDPDGRTITSTSLAMTSPLSVLAPTDGQGLPAGSAGALRKALRGGGLAIVPGEVSKAVAWWTVAPSGFVRAVMEPGAGMSKIGGGKGKVPKIPGGPSKNMKRNPGQRNSSNTGGNESVVVRRAVADNTLDTMEQAGDVFESNVKNVAKDWTKFNGGK